MSRTGNNVDPDECGAAVVGVDDVGANECGAAVVGETVVGAWVLGEWVAPKDNGLCVGEEEGGVGAKVDTGDDVVGDKVVGDVVLAVTVTVTVTFIPEEQCEPLPTAQTNVMVPPLAKAPELYVIGSKVYDVCPGVSSSVPMFEQDAVGEIFTVCPFAGYLKTT